jgi:hypothetical protein
MSPQPPAANVPQPPQQAGRVLLDLLDMAAPGHKPTLQEVDDNGDFIFRFKLNLSEDDRGQTLVEFYRETISDLLTIVRFYSKGKPVIVDSFAFHDAPQAQVPILAPRVPAPPNEWGR